MKTFETEKHNIPEGATHYINESGVYRFSWGKYVGGDLHLRLSGGKFWRCVVNKFFSGVIEPIPQPKEVEWVNGDIVNTPDGEGCLVAEVFRDGYSYWVVQFKDNFHPFCVTELSKPESPEDKAKRELLETSYDLYRKTQVAINSVACESFESFCSNKHNVCFWSAIVNETNYRCTTSS